MTRCAIADVHRGARAEHPRGTGPPAAQPPAEPRAHTVVEVEHSHRGAQALITIGSHTIVARRQKAPVGAAIVVVAIAIVTLFVVRAFPITARGTVADAQPSVNGCIAHVPGGRVHKAVVGAAVCVERVPVIALLENFSALTVSKGKNNIWKVSQVHARDAAVNRIFQSQLTMVVVAP